MVKDHDGALPHVAVISDCIVLGHWEEIAIVEMLMGIKGSFSQPLLFAPAPGPHTKEGGGMPFVTADNYQGCLRTH